MADTLKQACNGGIQSDCVRLGELYADGRGVPRDEARAASLYEQACNSGKMHGCFLLAKACLNGKGISKDEARSASLFQQVCDKVSSGSTDFVGGCEELGELYLNGVGVPSDKERAAKAFELGCGSALRIENGQVMPMDKASTQKCIKEHMSLMGAIGYIGQEGDTPNYEIILGSEGACAYGVDHSFRDCRWWRENDKVRIEVNNRYAWYSCNQLAATLECDGQNVSNGHWHFVLNRKGGP
ncbi:MAG TPA: tetratricopeptide repeat protein [Polyangia bacterium]|nr:tetratricopeptide repeat protein [Polyangia bacterium]